ncbi:MAG: CRR6 family NdhI maturation factor [Synechococcales cyanobacterium T60_A2020_003]|nr:CRR6 family NdhI maturation factor [Synechococcales cyanobacterium T60_A2020_003]
MTTPIYLDAHCIHALDLSPAKSVIEPMLNAGNIGASEQSVAFSIDYPREPNDPREISEIPEVRLWFVRLDAVYPWFPFVLDWGTELSRYTAMLVPHQFSRSDGIQYNPEALELFVMHKIFIILDWLKQGGLEGRSKVKALALTLGYELDDAFFDLVE